MYPNSEHTPMAYDFTQIKAKAVFSISTKHLDIKRAFNEELYCLCETEFAHTVMCFIDKVHLVPT